jgi:GAF domain-containing protein
VSGNGGYDSGGYDGDDQVNQTLQAVAVVARALHVADARLQPTLDAVVSMAAATTGFEAGLVLVTRGRLVPQATTGRAPHLLDRAQQQLGAGPCIEAATVQSTVRVVDTLADGRWGEFCATAAGLGVRSMLCVPLGVDERCLGTLSLFADRPAAFTDRDERVTALFATLAALALADAQRAEQLRTALESRDLIGQAKGILMERERITASDAFDRLAEQSQLRNVKLTVVARHLVETGELLGTRSAGSAVQRAAE